MKDSFRVDYHLHHDDHDHDHDDDDELGNGVIVVDFVVFLPNVVLKIAGSTIKNDK